MYFAKQMLALVVSLAFGQAALAATSGTSEVLYITNGDAKTIQAIQGNVVTITNSSTPGTTHYAIAVRNTIWTADYGGGIPGRQEYTPAL